MTKFIAQTRLFNACIMMMMTALCLFAFSSESHAQRGSRDSGLTIAQPQQVVGSAPTAGVIAPSLDTPPPVIDLNAAVGDTIPNISFGEGNEYFQRLMQIQYQIAMLTTMNERQRQMDQMRATFKNIGLPFIPPPPERGACAQLPPNAICARAYPDLYADYRKRFSGQPDPTTGKTFEEMLQESLDEKLQQELTEKKEQAKKAEPPAPTGPVFAWSDIACRAGICRASIAKRENPTQTRQTVRVGDKIEGDFVVQAIGIDGVRVSHPKKGTFDLDAFDKKTDTSARNVMMDRREATITARRAGQIPAIPVPAVEAIAPRGRQSLDDLDPLVDDAELDQTLGGLISELGRLGANPDAAAPQSDRTRRLGFDDLPE